MTIHKKFSGFGMRNLVQAVCCLLVLLVALMTAQPRLTNSAQTADGNLDPTFGEGGIVVTDISNTSNGIIDMKMQPDGKLLVLGSFQDDLNHTHGFVLARYNPDGTLDSSFGNGGKVLTAVGESEGASSFDFQPGGKILVAGVAYVRGQDFGLMRYSNDGTLDRSFGNDGKLIKDFNGVDECSDIVVQPDGKILLAGWGGRGNLQAAAFCIVRYKENGRIDSSFGDNGIVKTIFSNGFDFAYAIALQPDGKFVVAGRAEFNSARSPMAVARYNSDGSLDTSFGDSGKLTLNLSGSRNQANTIVIQPDGKLLVAGWAGNENENAPEILALVRLNSNGTRDTSFGLNGVVTNNLSRRGGEAHSILLQSDGKIIVAGIAGFLRSAHPEIDFAVLRYNSNGTLDQSFGLGGIAITNLQRKFNIASAIVIQPDDKLVVAGYTAFTDTVGTAKSDFALARYNNSSNHSFDTCLRDDSNGNILQINSGTGEYRFTNCSTGLVLSGTGAVKVKECKTTLSHTTADRNISVVIKSCKQKASGSIDFLFSGKSFSLSDNSTTESTCACQ